MSFYKGMDDARNRDRDLEGLFWGVAFSTIFFLFGLLAGYCFWGMS